MKKEDGLPFYGRTAQWLKTQDSNSQMLDLIDIACEHNQWHRACLSEVEEIGEYHSFRCIRWGSGSITGLASVRVT